MVEPINKAIDVSTDPATAFSIFTERLDAWWPLDTNSVSAMSGEVSKSLELEPRVGGQVVETRPAVNTRWPSSAAARRSSEGPCG